MNYDKLISPEDEQQVLGSLLLDYEQYGAIAFLKEADFGKVEHRLIFGAICKAMAQYNTLDIGTVAMVLEQDQTLSTVGGHEYLASLMACVPSGFQVLPHAKRVFDLSMRRGLGRASDSFANMLAEEGKEVPNALNEYNMVLSRASARLAEIEVRQNISNPADALANSTMWNVGIGLPGLSRYLRLISQKSHYIVGNPGVGKTTLGVTMALSAALQNIPSYVFLAETDVLDASGIVLGAYGKLEAWFLNALQYDPSFRTESNIQKLRAIWDECVPQDLPLYLQDFRGRRTDDVLAIVAGIHNSVVVIDHAYAFVFQSESKAEYQPWIYFTAFFKSIERLAARNGNVIVVLNQYTQDGMKEWKRLHVQSGGAGGSNIACTQINIMADDELNSGPYKGVRFFIAKAKASLVREQLPSGEIVSVQAENAEGVLYINRAYRSVAEAVPYAGTG